MLRFRLQRADFNCPLSPLPEREPGRSLGFALAVDLFAALPLPDTQDMDLAETLTTDLSETDWH